MTQNAASRPPTANTGNGALDRRLLRPHRQQARAAPAMAKIAGTMCDSPMHASSSAVSALCLPGVEHAGEQTEEHAGRTRG